MNLTTSNRWKQIQRRWVVVAVITLLAVLGSTMFALNARETYTGKSTLILSGRTPDQDAVMVVGYLTLFNDPAAIGQLKTEYGIPEDVIVEAQTAGASPILNIVVTADDPTVAQDLAETMAHTFSSDINATQQKGKDERLADLQSRLDGVGPLAPDGSVNPYFTALQTQIDQVKSDPTNELMVLQARAGVNENAPRTVFTVISGALGGLVLGVLVALGMAALSRRPSNAAELRQRTGIDALAVVPSAGNTKSATIRRERLRSLASVVSLEGPPPPVTVAVTETRGGTEAREVAMALAVASAERGSRTILVYADNEPGPDEGKIGFNDALANVGLVHEVLACGNVNLLDIVPAGPTLDDRYSLMTRERIGVVFDALRYFADTVVVVAPPIADAVEAPLLCAAADVTLLVVARKSAKFTDVIRAADELRKTRAHLLGAVLIDRSAEKNPSAGLEDLPSNDASLETERIVVPFAAQRAGASSAKSGH